MERVVRFGELVLAVLFNFGSNNSLPGLFVAGCIAIVFTLARARKRRIPLAVMRRALLPRRIVKSSSGRTDIAFTLAAFLIFGLFFGWVVLSQETVRAFVLARLNEFAPAGLISGLPRAMQTAMTTVALYIGYEFAYWLDHYLSHRIPVLWRFHAVHHSAESLSPLTNFRAHPVDTIVFANIMGLTLGIVLAILDQLFGARAEALTIRGTNALLLIAFMLLTTLQHSHLWISFQGIWGKLFISPAHHQIHHSDDPAHFNTNLGSTLAIWDWLFGTLYVPTASREKLTFGVAGMRQPHGLRSALLRPFYEAARELRRTSLAPVRATDTRGRTALG